MIYLENTSKSSQVVYIPRNNTSDIPVHTFELQSKKYKFTENTVAHITPDEGYVGISGGTITVDIDYSNVYQSGYTQGHQVGFVEGKEAQKALLSEFTATTNGLYTSDTGYSGFTVNVDTTLSSITLTGNGITYTSETGWSGVTVDVPLMAITSTIKDNGSYVWRASDYHAQGWDVVSLNVDVQGSEENRLNTLLKASITSITESDLSGVTTIGSSVFQGQFGLVSCAPISATSIASYAFENCTSLTGVTFVNNISLGAYVFRYCNNLTLSMDNDISIIGLGNNTFDSCYSITGNINLGMDALTSARSFRYCSGITSFSFTNPKFYILGSTNTFEGCTGVQYLDFSKSTKVPTLSNPLLFSAFTANYEIRVPSSLYNDWKSASGWSDISSHIVSI